VLEDEHNKDLGEAVGIQSQGTVDKTETQTKRLTSALIVGRFKRGRVDKPMTIHQGNIRGQLGMIQQILIIKLYRIA
jgi:hypothetical protein